MSYYTHPALSQSGVKAALECPRAFVCGHQRETTAAMLVGRLFEAEVCCDVTGLAALRNDPRIMRKDGKAPLAKFEHVAQMVARWRAVEAWQDTARAVQQPEWFGAVAGAEIKGKPDLWYEETRVIEDIKTAAKLEDAWLPANAFPWRPERGYVRWWLQHGYDLQAAWYWTLAVQNGLAPQAYRIRVVTSEDPCNAAWLEIIWHDGGTMHAHPAVWAALSAIDGLVAMVQNWRANPETTRWCGVCEWCRTNATITAPTREE